MIFGLLLAAAAQNASGAMQVPMSPPSLGNGELEACQPDSLPSAAACLETALNEEDQARAASQRYFRPALDMAMQRAWRLDNPNAPLSRWLAERGIYKPMAVGGLVLGELDARRKGYTVDYAAAAKALESVPSGPPPPPPPEFAAILAGETPEGWTKLPVEECSSPTAGGAEGSGMQSFGCYRDANGKVRTMAAVPLENSNGN